MHDLFGARALLLDLDNTLYSYAPCHISGLKAACSAAMTKYKLFDNSEHFENSYNAARQQIKKLVPQQAASHSRLLYFQQLVFEKLGILDSKLVLDLCAAYWDNFIESMQPAEYMLDFLLSCKARCIKIAIISDMTAELQHRKIIKLKINGLVDLMITSEEVGAEKPSTLGISRAFTQLGISAQQSCFLGDDLERDIGAAKAAGMRSILLCQTEPKATEDLIPDLFINSFSQLL